MSLSDVEHMQELVALASLAAQQGEVPIASRLIQDQEIIATISNTREASLDPLGHAELSVIRLASQRLSSWRLMGTTLYVTVEPCLMCTGAIYQARIPKVVFGCANPKGGALRYIQSIESTLGLNHHVDIVGGVLDDACADLMRTFFEAKRAAKKVAKTSDFP